MLWKRRFDRAMQWDMQNANETAKPGAPMSREQFWFFHPFRVRYSEIDGQGVVFNAHYLTYFDTTITEYFRALGYDQYADAKQTGEDFHVVKSVIEYKAPVRFDWELEVGARVARIGNSSLTFELAIFLKDGADALVTGEIVWVNTNQQTHRPVPISKAIRDRISAREKHLRA
jgi:acyl-CoA thioester hydrolase